MNPDIFHSEPTATIFAVFAFVLGAIVGSFLNVAIYRMPRNLSVNKPKRSFCPSCNKQIPWYENIPLLSWLLLRGRCSKCGSGIAFRYFFVELLTAAMFLAVWLCFPPAFALPYWIFVSLLIVATFIDFDFFIIPDEITIGGVALGVLCSLAVPALMGVDSVLMSLGLSIGSAAAGYLLLWGVVVLGKMAFGKKKMGWQEPVDFHFEQTEDDWFLHAGDEKISWMETFTFAGEKDELHLHCESLTVRGKDLTKTLLIGHSDKVVLDGKALTDAEVLKLRGKLNSVVIPREAMGFGDVKFIAAIGAFLGWQSVLFTIFAASVVGSVIGVSLMLVNRKEWTGKIPFGPYLSLGALLWMFIGPQLVTWYFGLMQLPE